MLHPEGLLPQKVIVALFVSWLSLRDVSRLESGHLKSLICISVILDMQIQVIFEKKVILVTIPNKIKKLGSSHQQEKSCATFSRFCPDHSWNNF